jgi:magnesium chelatase family protein
VPIVLGIPTATGAVATGKVGGCAVVGELALDGQIYPVRGVLAVGLVCCRKSFQTILAPAENRAEASAVRDLRVLAPSTSTGRSRC